MIQATLHQFKVFEATARHGSITRAAEELFLAQSTVSMQVRQLSKTIGLPLFEQVGKRLYLTEAGKELLHTCQDVFDRLDKYEMFVSNLKGMKQGKLRLAVITTAKYFVPQLLGTFSQIYPGIDICLQVINHERVIERLNDNQDDLYIMSQLPSDSQITYNPFLDNPLVVIAPSNHPLVEEQDIPLHRLAQEPFIMREPGSGTRSSVQKLFSEHGIKAKVRLELGSNEAIKQAIAAGLGISVLSRHTLSGLSACTSKLTILEVQHFPIQRFWYVVYPKGKQLSIVAKTFYDYLLEESKKTTNLA